MKHMSTLALVELLTEVVAELDDRGRAEAGTDGLFNGWDPIRTYWGDLTNGVEGWSFGWHGEGSAEAALRDRGQGAEAERDAREVIAEAGADQRDHNSFSLNNGNGRPASGRLADETIALVRDRTSLVELVLEHGIALHPTGQAHIMRGLCPLHQETRPSFIVRTDKNLFWCHGCGVGGDAISFAMETGGGKTNFVEAVEKLAERSNLPLRYLPPAAAPLRAGGPFPAGPWS